MTERIEVDCDYDGLLKRSSSIFNNVPNYRIVVLEESGGYAKFRVDSFPLGELGTFEVLRTSDISCTVIFSNASMFDNHDEWLRQTEREIDQTAGRIDDKDKMELLSQRIDQKIEEVGIELIREKPERWKSAVAAYKRLFAELSQMMIARVLLDRKYSVKPQPIRQIADSTAGTVDIYGKLNEGFEVVVVPTSKATNNYPVHEVTEGMGVLGGAGQEIEPPKPVYDVWDKMTKETKEKFRSAWNIYLTMCEEYKNDVLDGASQKAKPTIQDFRARVISDMHWTVGERRLRAVITYGEANLIK